MFDRHKNKPTTPESRAPEPAATPAPAASAGANRSNAMIGPSIVISGTVSGDEDLLVQGRVEGTIELIEHQVAVGESGQVHADVTARVVKIEGAVSGDVTGKEQVIVTRSGNVRGNISAPRVTLEDGAMFTGSIDMTGGEKAQPAPIKGTSGSEADDAAPQLDLKSG